MGIPLSTIQWRHAITVISWRIGINTTAREGSADPQVYVA